MKDMDRRFVSLGRLIKQAIIEDDVFGLIEPKHDLTKFITVHTTPGKEAFKFSTSQDKVSQFMAWLKQQEKQGLLQTTTIPQIGTSLEKAWTDQYIADSYNRGVTRARYEMGATGMGTPGIEETGGISASMSTPFHMDRVGMLYTRTFEDLKGITAAMDSAISRILSQGMVDGDGPRSLAGKIVDATGVSRRRAMTLARTEIIRAHHSAMVQEYKNWAVEGVVVKAEWVDAGFNVCPECAKNNGKIFELSEIEGLIPLHPNCRCIALPTMPEKGVKAVEKVQEVLKPIEEIQKKELSEASDKFLKVHGDYYDKYLSRQELKDTLSWGDTLSSQKLNAIKIYTGNGYAGINAFLRGEIKDLDDIKKRSLITLEKTLKDSPKKPGVSYRSISIDWTHPELIQKWEKYKQKDIFIEEGFLSTSLDEKIAKDFSGVDHQIFMEIQGKKGVFISPYSEKMLEMEVLFSPGFKGRILKKEVKIKSIGKTKLKQIFLTIEEI
jgi:SPP1 gp7 family putative phage head morphogenesis protein